MPRESTKARRQRTDEIRRILHQTYPEAQCALHHEDAFELLVATILSAQCTDVRVNMVTPVLFAKYPTPHALAKADPQDLEEIVRSTGFFRNKAKNLRAAAGRIVEAHDGQVPATMEELLALPGVARKTANVVLGNAFGRNEGVVVDTHVARLSHRLGLTRHSQPDKIERDLMQLVPQEEWADFSHLLIFHGRAICTARKPDCPRCPVLALCPYGQALAKGNPQPGKARSKPDPKGRTGRARS